VEPQELDHAEMAEDTRKLVDFGAAAMTADVAVAADVASFATVPFAFAEGFHIALGHVAVVVAAAAVAVAASFENWLAVATEREPKGPDSCSDYTVQQQQLLLERGRSVVLAVDRIVQMECGRLQQVVE